MRRCWGIVFLVVSLASVAAANPVVTILGRTGSDPYSSGTLVLDPGDTFDIMIQISTDVALSAAQMYITDSSSLGYLTLNSVSWNTAVWDVGTTIEPATPYDMDSGNNYRADLGAMANGFDTGTGTFTFAELNLTLSEYAMSGQTMYLHATGLVFADTNFDSVGAQTGGPFVIQSSGQQVVPAPGAAMLGFIGLNMVGWIRRPRRGGASDRA